MSRRDDGWVRVVNGVYARGPYRIYRQTHGWSWSDVVQIHPQFPRGVAPTLAAAKAAVAKTCAAVQPPQETPE